MCVYFVGTAEDGPVKIGFSEDPYKRVAQLQTGHPHRLELLGYLTGGTREMERILHEAYRSYCRYIRRPPTEVGEWVPRWFAERVMEALRASANFGEACAKLIYDQGPQWIDVLGEDQGVSS